VRITWAASWQRKDTPCVSYRPNMVRPYVKAQKNDDRDAEAVAEVATRPTMRFVEIKSEAQLDMQTLHRARERLVAERTALINQVRSVLLERGIVVAQGRRKLETQLPDILADEALGLSTRIRELIADLREEWQTLNERITAFDAEFVSRARTDEAARRLATIPGIGSINATALVARWGMDEPLNVAAIWPLGSDWSRGNERPAGSPGCLASASAAIDICVRT
jgi:transposase